MNRSKLEKKKLIYRVGLRVKDGRLLALAEIYDDGSVEAPLTRDTRWNRKHKKWQEKQWLYILNKIKQGIYIIYSVPFMNYRYPKAFHTLSALFGNAIVEENWDEAYKAQLGRDYYHGVDFFGEGERWEPIDEGLEID